MWNVMRTVAVSHLIPINLMYSYYHSSINTGILMTSWGKKHHENGSIKIFIMTVAFSGNLTQEFLQWSEIILNSSFLQETVLSLLSETLNIKSNCKLRERVVVALSAWSSWYQSVWGMQKQFTVVWRALKCLPTHVTSWCLFTFLEQLQNFEGLWGKQQKQLLRLNETGIKIWTVTLLNYIFA